MEKKKEFNFEIKLECRRIDYDCTTTQIQWE